MENGNCHIVYAKMNIPLTVNIKRNCSSKRLDVGTIFIVANYNLEHYCNIFKPLTRFITPFIL